MANLNNKPTPFSVSELNRIEKNIKNYNKFADGVSDKLIKEVELYQKQYINYLRESDVKSVTDIGRLNPMQELGFVPMSTEYFESYPLNVNATIDMLEGIGVGTSLKAVDFNQTVRDIAKADFAVFANEAEQLDAMIKARLINSTVLGESYQKSVSLLADDMLGFGEKTGRLARFANTYMNTAFISLSRIVDQEAYKLEGGDKPTADYIFAGPLDNKTSPICVQHLGLILPREEWEDIGFNEGMDVFVEGLHYNCRHRLILVR